MGDKWEEEGGGGGEEKDRGSRLGETEGVEVAFAGNAESAGNAQYRTRDHARGLGLLPLDKYRMADNLGLRQTPYLDG